MAGLLSFVLAAAVAAATPAAPADLPRSGTAAVRIGATATILRAERASAVPEPGGLVRHVRRREGRAPVIEFE